MHPSKVNREHLHTFTDLPNIGPAAAADFQLLGYQTPQQLAGADPLALYHALCLASGSRQDPCVLDVLISVVDFLDGAPPQPWWHYTPLRKQRYGAL